MILDIEHLACRATIHMPRCTSERVEGFPEHFQRVFLEYCKRVRFTARTRDEISGFLDAHLSTHHPRTVFIQRLSLSCRHGGDDEIAKRLLREAEVAAIQEGCSRAELAANRSNLRFRRFYEQSGYLRVVSGAGAVIDVSDGLLVTEQCRRSSGTVLYEKRLDV